MSIKQAIDALDSEYCCLRDLEEAALDMAAWIKEALPWLRSMRETAYDSDRE